MAQFQIPTASQPIIQSGTTVNIDRVWFRFLQNLLGRSDSGRTSTGTTQDDAFTISQVYTEFTSVPAGSGCILSGALAVTFYIYNRDATNALNVYPPVGAKIDGLATNAPTTISALGHARFALLYPTQAYTS